MKLGMRAKARIDGERWGPGAGTGEGERERPRVGALGEEGRALPMLALLRERLDEAHGAGETALKLGPEDLRSLCSEAGAGVDDPVGAFRTLVDSNLVRLRGRWREGVSGVTAPVYVARLVGRVS